MNKDTEPQDAPQEELSIGDLLRTEREKKGISRKRLAEDIKVRENVIDALENEEWDKLPARVFIKGFIRSYTISIGYDTIKALRLFDKCVPSSRGEDSPVPLTASRKKSRAVYYTVPILIFLAVAVYMFSVRDKGENGIEPDRTVTEAAPSNSETGQEANVPGQTESVVKPSADEVEEPKISEPAVQERILPGPEKKTATVVSQRIPEDKPEKKEQENTQAEENRGNLEEENTREKEPPGTVYEEETPVSESVSDEPAVHLLTLSARLIERSYVRMIVDDNPPKEYIFPEGATPSWTAERGFEVTVGNAAGIEFVFNGKTYNNIGREGRVKTLRFPENFETNREE